VIIKILKSNERMKGNIMVIVFFFLIIFK